MPEKDSATRNQSGIVQQKVAELVPSLVGGSADLTGSTKTWIKDSGTIAKGAFEHRNFHFGVREHGMGAFANGMALSDGFIPYTATFLVFSDYMRPAIRLAALMQLPVVYVFTHDSIGVGEDGPTHQPVEHLASLRAMPGLRVVRPADGAETAEAWRLALLEGGPTALALTRQKLPELDHGPAPATGVRTGAYVLNPEVESPELSLLASGSEIRTAPPENSAQGSGPAVATSLKPCRDCGASSAAIRVIRWPSASSRWLR